MTTTVTPLGTIAGVQMDGAVGFLGIRFAEPPTGDRRFKPPVPVAPWGGTLDATSYGPAAPQLHGPGLDGSVAEPEPTDEDCLFLNVFTPACDDRRRPVYFWVHGGGWAGGSGRNYDGTLFAREHDIVVVTVNYRLGPLGFMPVDHLSDDPAHRTAQNSGLLDQACALRWVRDNITAFGGDPGDVTLGGESAGGGSVAALLAMPSVEGLYHKAIIQSAALDFGPVAPRREEKTNVLIRELGGDPDENGLQTLSDASPDELLAAVQAVGLALAEDPIVEFFDTGGPGGTSPSVDGIVLPLSPVEAVAAKGRSNVPLMIGTNRHEGPMFGMGVMNMELTEDDLRAAFVARGVDADAALAAYRSFRPDGSLGQMFGDGLTETLFRSGTVAFTDAVVAGGVPAFVYLFTIETPIFGGRLGSSHALELFYLWNWASEDEPQLAGPDAPLHVGPVMRELWAAFIKTGKPAIDSGPSWPTYEPETRPTLVIDETLSVELNPDGDTLAVWF